jgi:hypothetical protein
MLESDEYRNGRLNGYLIEVPEWVENWKLLMAADDFTYIAICSLERSQIALIELDVDDPEHIVWRPSKTAILREHRRPSSFGKRTTKPTHTSTPNWGW